MLNLLNTINLVLQVILRINANIYSRISIKKGLRNRQLEREDEDKRRMLFRTNIKVHRFNHAGWVGDCAVASARTGSDWRHVIPLRLGCQGYYTGKFLLQYWFKFAITF